MSLTQTPYQIVYPESDGQPMAETDLHVHWTIRLRDILKHRYRGQRVYVGTDLFVYYVEGRPDKNVAPDVFVVLDCDPHMRDTFKTWEEGRVPDVVFEITSKGSREEDQWQKPNKYALIGVKEYFLYDPRAEYLHTPLQAFRLANGAYEPVEPNRRGQLECRSLGITLELDGRDLLLRDASMGEILPTEVEAAQAERDAAQAERDAAQAERDAAQAERDAAVARNASLEAELERLRTERGKGDRQS